MGPFNRLAFCIFGLACVSIIVDADVVFSLKNILKCGFDPLKILDVGANAGVWSKTVQSEVFPQAKYFLVEANDRHRDLLRASGFPFEIALVGKDEGQVTFFKSIVHHEKDTQTGNSVFRENTESFDKSDQIVTNITTIDNIIKKRNLGPFEFMKLDIQGSELAALHGAIESLRHVEVVLTEAQVMNYNNGAPTFLDLHKFMEDNGFALYDVCDLMRHAKTRTLIQVDVVWVKKKSFLWSKDCTDFPIPQQFNLAEEDLDKSNKKSSKNTKTASYSTATSSRSKAKKQAQKQRKKDLSVE